MRGQGAQPLLHHPRRGAERLRADEDVSDPNRLRHKAVITGDVTQIDLARDPERPDRGAPRAAADVRGIAFTEFTSADVVRHPVGAKIISAYGSTPEARHIDAPGAAPRTGR
jgi:hypothetical protein